MNSQKICTACGTQFPLNNKLPELCPICNDDRQYIPETGQTWTTADELSNKYTVDIKKINDNLYSIRMNPSFAIGQRAFLIITPGGNILWDCIPLLNKEVTELIRSKGSLGSIAFSHPHYYSNMNDWAAAFNCPVYIHNKDEQWITDKSAHTNLWVGTEKPLWDGIKIIHTGGHFAGSCILHVPGHSDRGTIFCGDSLQIARSKRHIGIMYSYPNLIPLPLHEIDRIQKKVLEIKFDSMYGAFDFQNLPANARQIFIDSMKKYID